MAELQHSQIRSKLLDGVVSLIDMSDVGARPTGDVEVHALSRSVAATVLCMTSDIDINQAVSSPVDGGKDNGIDAIYYDSQSKTLFLVQSKWNVSHSGSVDSVAVLKFL